MTRLLYWLDRRIGRYAIENLTSWIIVAQVALWVTSFWGEGGVDFTKLYLYPDRVWQGEVWRLFTVILVRPSGLIIFWYLFWLCGSSLEAVWGAFRYNAYLLIGWIFSVAAAMATGSPMLSCDLVFVSVLLAWNRLAPGLTIHLFGAIALPLRWLAALAWLLFALRLAMGTTPQQVMVLAALANYLLFFAGDHIRSIGHRRKRQSIHSRTSSSHRVRHKCHACGRNSKDEPKLAFRYCSKCSGGQCYCPDHLKDHEHV